MTTPDRYDAITALVQTPDPFDGWRTHKQTQPGAPDRWTRYQHLPRAYVVMPIIP